jgi:hypothetical protein
MRDFACVCVDFVLFPIVRVALSKCLAMLGEMVPVLGLFFGPKSGAKKCPHTWGTTFWHQIGGQIWYTKRGGVWYRKQCFNSCFFESLVLMHCKAPSECHEPLLVCTTMMFLGSGEREGEGEGEGSKGS